MGEDELVRREEPGPDDAWRPKSTPDDQDTEAHRKPVPRDAGPDQGRGRSAVPDNDDTEAPGPDESKFSDRSLKVGIVPVEW